MSHAAPANPAADRNLLYGMLALQMGFVTRDALLSGMHAWVFAKDKALGELLQEREALSPQQRQVLDAVVAEHLKAHGGDARRSLAEAAHPATLDGDLESVADADLQASMAAAGGTLATTVDRLAADGMRYRVLRPHARGGLGVVSVARDVELGREVALKEIDGRHAVDAVSQGRFVREAEITGGLEHPGIVPVYGLGRYADGRPYYAMRFIRGESLQEAVRKWHASQAGYTLRALLTRFVAVCNAIAYAHNRGVIHRDLKPPNVMLGPYGETLVVDWGLAKVIGREPAGSEGAGSAEMTLQTPSGEGSMTQVGSALGTPSFMSPEQARGEVATLGPATDIYSLGATLYAMLTGQPPIQGRSTAEVLEKVRQGNWRPARQVKDSTPAALDAVCRKALALRPEERYATALALAADVEHWLADEPVTACREPWTVRAARWRRQHPRSITAAAALLLASAALSLVVALNREQARRIAEKGERETSEQKEIALANEKTAKEREAETRSVLDFVQDKVFAAARPKGQEGGLGPEVTLRRAVEAALPFVQQSFHEQPLIEARLRMTLGMSFWYLGEPRIAADQFQAARAIYTEHCGADHPDTLASMNNLALSYRDLGRHAEALKLHEETLAIRKAKLGPDHLETLRSMNNLANSYRALGRDADALKLHEEALALQKVKLGPDHLETLRSMNNVVDSCLALGRYAEALKLGEETLALSKAKVGPDHPDTLTIMHNLARIYSALGRYAEAVKLGEETLGLRQAKLGVDHPATFASMSGLADCFVALGRHAEALKLREETLAQRKAKLGTDHPDTLGSMNNLAVSYTTLGRHAEALKLLEETLPLYKAKLGPDHPDTLMSMNNLVMCYCALGRNAEALELGEKTLELCKAKLGPDHVETLRSMDRVAEIYAALGRHAEAAQLLEEALALRRVKFRPDHPDTVRTLYNIACYHAVMVPKSMDPLQQADRAMAWLKQAVAAGYKHAETMKKDTDLAALRDRDDFKQLLAEVEAAAKKDGEGKK
jgi:serine/threonine protein kinase